MEEELKINKLNTPNEQHKEKGRGQDQHPKKRKTKRKVCRIRDQVKKPEKMEEEEEYIKIISWNARSIINKQKLEFIHQLAADIICIQETWLTPDIDLTSYQKKGESIMIRFDRKERRGGGSLVILGPGVVLRRERVTEDNGIIKCVIGNKPIWLVNTYLPKGSKTQIQELFKAITRYIPQEEMDRVIMIGDFNIDIQEKGDRVVFLEQLSKQLSFKIMKPQLKTRGKLYLTLQYVQNSYTLK
jgi:hypothetical protein